MTLIDPRDAGHGGKLEPDPPPSGARFYALGRSGTTLRVEALIVVADDWHHPKSFLVRAEDGTFWTLVSRDPVLDGIAYVGTPLGARQSVSSEGS